MTDSILNKIKKCLALSKSSNPHEAAIALKQAHALMAKHNLEIIDVNLSTVGSSSKIKGGKNKQPMSYESDLACMVADMYNCKALHIETCADIYSWSLQGFINSYQSMWSFVGVKPKHEIAAYTFQVLYRQLQKARKEYITNNLYRCKKFTKTQRANSFCEGWIYEVSKTVRAFAKTEDELNEIEIIDSYIDKYFNIGDGLDSRKTKERSSSDIIAGIESAKDAVLNNAVDKSFQEQHLIKQSTA